MKQIESFMAGEEFDKIAQSAVAVLCVSVLAGYFTGHDIWIAIAAAAFIGCVTSMVLYRRSENRAIAEYLNYLKGFDRQTLQLARDQQELSWWSKRSICAYLAKSPQPKWQKRVA